MALKILYVGDLSVIGTCSMRLRSQEELGHEVQGISSSWPGRRASVYVRARHKLGYPLERRGENRAILNAVESQDFDILWIDKGLTIWPGTLQAVRRRRPRLLIAGYSPDDMGQRHNQSRYFVRGLPFYHVYFTTKTYNVPELQALGVPRAVFSPNAYDPGTHRPVELTPEEQRKFCCDVGFIGTYEDDRADQLAWLASQGIAVRVYGTHWERYERLGRLAEPVRDQVIGDEYAKAICGSAINLCFLRKKNRDLQTTRSVEIPACGAFMLAERTDEHLGLFAEGKEAAYFSTRQELAEKIRYYLAHPDERRRIAEAGLRRCIEGGYSYRERMRVMLAQAKEQTI